MPVDEAGILAHFIVRLGITAVAEPVDRNPNMDNRDMDHWRVVLRRGRHQLTVYFSKGYGHNGAEPTVEEVLDCLASDAASVDNARSFEEWAGDFGFDIDSRKAERIYRACGRQATRLRNFLGEQEEYETLLYQTERM